MTSRSMLLAFGLCVSISRAIRDAYLNVAFAEKPNLTFGYRGISFREDSARIELAEEPHGPGLMPFRSTKSPLTSKPWLNENRF